MKKAISNTSWPYNGHIFVHPKDLAPQNGVIILSTKQLINMTQPELTDYKAQLRLAESSAPTDLERENLTNQINRVNSVLNSQPINNLKEMQK